MSPQRAVDLTGSGARHKAAVGSVHKLDRACGSEPFARVGGQTLEQLSRRGSPTMPRTIACAAARASVSAHCCARSTVPWARARDSARWSRASSSASRSAAAHRRSISAVASARACAMIVSAWPSPARRIASASSAVTRSSIRVPLRLSASGRHPRESSGHHHPQSLPPWVELARRKRGVCRGREDHERNVGRPPPTPRGRRQDRRPRPRPRRRA